MKKSAATRSNPAVEIIRTQLARADLLPDSYAQYRPLIADGLCFFLEHLPRVRLQRMLAEQAQLPIPTKLPARLIALLHHIPVLHKLGQVVARDRRLLPEFRHKLQQLESFSPRIPMKVIIPLLRSELPNLGDISLGAVPLAEGSVAVVVPFRTKRSAQEGVLKVLKPGVERHLKQDLRILNCLGQHLDETCHARGLPALQYAETFKTIEALLLAEVDLEGEQENLREAKLFFAGNEDVRVPALLPFCSRGVTAMERLTGKTLGALANGVHNRERLAHTLASALIAAPLFSRHPSALFHADPHAGNLLFTDDGKLGLLDWSLIGRLEQEDRTQLTQLFLGILSLNSSTIASAVARLSEQEPDWTALFAVIEGELLRLSWGTLPGVTFVLELLDQLVSRANVRFGPTLLLFRKTMLTLEGVLADLVPNYRGVRDAALIGAFLSCWTAEWPQRFLRPWTSRDWRTHVSNGDLLNLWFSVPTLVNNWWALTGLQMLRTPNVLRSLPRSSSRTHVPVFRV